MTNNTIHIKSGKGNKDRIVPIPSRITAYIKDYIQNLRDTYVEASKKDNEALFISVTGNRLIHNDYYDMLSRWIKNAGIESLQEKELTLHSFRHTLATHILYRGMEIEHVKQLLGHSSIDSTSVYLHYVNQLKNEQ